MFVQEALNEALKLESALAKFEAQPSIRILFEEGATVITDDTNSISDGTSHSSSEVRACCFTFPLTVVVMPRSAGSTPVSIHGPSGQNVSNPLARVHCPSIA